VERICDFIPPFWGGGRESGVYDELQQMGRIFSETENITEAHAPAPRLNSV